MTMHLYFVCSLVIWRAGCHVKWLIQWSLLHLKFDTLSQLNRYTWRMVLVLNFYLVTLESEIKFTSIFSFLFSLIISQTTLFLWRCAWPNGIYQTGKLTVGGNIVTLTVFEFKGHNFDHFSKADSYLLFVCLTKSERKRTQNQLLLLFFVV